MPRYWSFVSQVGEDESMTFILTFFGVVAAVLVLGFVALTFATDIMLPVTLMLVVAALVHEVFHG
ncbi:hypothetical protein AA11825_1111 [Acetobacter pomorum DSM 11825]|nr:hypothetical protein AA11825_1111 [Acetobacter pomorum DSM 11825]